MSKVVPEWVKDVMEFAHNMALALVLAGFGAYAHFVEPVGDWPDWNRTLAFCCFGLAMLWSMFCGFWFSEKLLAHTGLRQRKWVNVLVGGLIIGLSGIVVIFSTLIPDNNHIVEICEKVEKTPADKIHKSDECQRLYQRRAAYERRLRGQ